MINYKSRSGWFICKRVLTCQGSVFPFAAVLAIPCGVLAFLIKLAMDHGYFPLLVEDGYKSILQDNSIWSGFTFLVGFLTVFRTSQAYNRFWDGCTSMHKMRAEWFDACSALVAFCKFSTADPDVVGTFQGILVRLFSMLHAVALADIEDTTGDNLEDVVAFRFALVDAGGLDSETLAAVKASNAKVELLFQWIQQLIVQNIENGVLRIPPPILSRSFQELANGMVAFHEAVKISTIPFPFPYAQSCEVLLILHWFFAPFMVSQYATSPIFSALFCFLQVFVYWSLNAIAVEIENPFGMDANDLDAGAMQEEMNHDLMLLLDPRTKRTPQLASETSIIPGPELSRRYSLSELWGLEVEDEEAMGKKRSSRNSRSSRRVSSPSGMLPKNGRATTPMSSVIGSISEQHDQFFSQEELCHHHDLQDDLNMFSTVPQDPQRERAGDGGSSLGLCGHFCEELQCDAVNSQRLSANHPSGHGSTMNGAYSVGPCSAKALHLLTEANLTESTCATAFMDANAPAKILADGCTQSHPVIKQFDWGSGGAVCKNRSDGDGVNQWRSRSSRGSRASVLTASSVKVQAFDSPFEHYSPDKLADRRSSRT